MMRCAWLSVAAAIALTHAAPASADEELVELRYAAPASCPAREIVEAEIRGRTPSVRLGAPARRVFAITIETTGDGFRGTLAVDQVADKQLAAERCDDLATALALVTALAIDPLAADRPHAAPPPLPRAWSAELEIGAMLESGVAPGALFGVVVDARATLQRYQVELAMIAGHDMATQDTARARFTWLAVRPGACRLWLTRDLTLGACGHLEVGAVRASGDMIINQRDLTRLWLAAGAHGSAEMDLVSRIFGQLQLGLSLPLVRDRYLFAPNVSIHDTPSVTGWMVVGIGMRFL